ncbi:MAG: DUF2059 domain-containing protein [Flavobacteriaceae bacterium]|nr:DUF2059 domain-containing protein [Flavobacteriaceae bacterium]
MKKFILFLLLIVSFSAIAQDENNKKMVTYLEANGTISYYSSVVDRMFDFMKKEYETINVPDTVWSDLKSVKVDALNEITELVAQVYEGHFTGPEIQEILNFYSTETGKKITSQEELTEEEIQRRDIFYTSALGQKISESANSLNNVLQEITQSWSADLFRLVTHKLEEKGYFKNE